MKAVQTIRRVGFRKWYERELLRSHANLVLLLLSAVGLLAAVEVYGDSTQAVDRLQVVAAAAVAAAIGLMALRRYLYLLNHAEYVADQAACGACGVYASWDAVSEDAGAARLTACCRRCGHRWDISL